MELIANDVVEHTPRASLGEATCHSRAFGTRTGGQRYGVRMWLEAIVSLEDFQALAAELLPVRVQLGSADSDHYLFLSAASQVSLVEGRGLRIVCSAQIRWPVLGMDIPIDVDSLTVMLEPSVPNESGQLFVGVQLEHADVAWVPSVLDKRIVAGINEALKQKMQSLPGVSKQRSAVSSRCPRCFSRCARWT